MASKQILEGIRVIDASTVLAAPLTANLLGDFGAEVIKVEQPSVGDVPRGWGHNHSWKVTGRNKKSVTLNLRMKQGIHIFHELVANSDLIITNYRLSTLQKWGIDYADLIKVKENIVMLHLTGFGRTGPYNDRPGFARIGEAFSGLTYMTGYPDRKPIFPGYAMGDALAGGYGAYSVMLALYHYKLTGEGQLIDYGLYEPLLRVMENYIVDYDIEGKVTEREGTHNPGLSPNDIYIAKDNKMIVLVASSDAIFKKLVKAIGHPELIEDSKFSSNLLRVKHREELDVYINKFFSTYNGQEAYEILLDANVTCGFINSVEDVCSDPHVNERGNIISIYDPEHDREIKMQGVVPIMSKTPGKVNWPGPELGSHNKEIYQELLGISKQEIEELKLLGVV